MSLSNKAVFKVSPADWGHGCSWWWFHLVAFQVATVLTVLQALLADISPDMHFTFEHKRSAVEKMEKSFFPTFFSFCSPSKEACEWGKKKQARQGSNFYPSLSENRYTRVPRQSKRFHACCPSKCILSHPTVPKGVLTICTRWEAKGEGKEEANWQRERKREAERLDAFSTLLHFSLAPRGFSKAFSKNTSGCVMDQTAAAATSQPTQQTVALIFQSLSVSVLCLFYTLPGKLIFLVLSPPSSAQLFPSPIFLLHLQTLPPTYIPPSVVPLLCVTVCSALFSQDWR